MVSNSELTEKIIKKAKSLGASIAGVASVESLKNSPSHMIYPKIGLNLNENFHDSKEGSHAQDVFWPESAVSVVVIGIEHNPKEPELDWWDGKGTPGNRILIKVNNALSDWIENTLLITTHKLPYFVEKGGIFLKDAAVHAGLGCIGKNNLVVTPEYGPRIRFRALLLDKEASPTVSTQFNPCEKCEQPCRKACPVKAFQHTLYSPDTLGQHILPGINGTYDRVRCNIKMEKDIDEAARTMSTDDESRQENRQLIMQFEKSHISKPNVEMSFSYCVKYCRKCELSCPVGSA
ncbi:epoxyqueuosine reductase [Desulfopila aestuarii]|uniref:Epoxyqueuosine reductase n=1 Tax=Desulfopila aestuarii DSM 18488 TaxID=1121416 RepID=A0A1M7Y3N4_9BACT|nr:epoxyqueuosine reductase [Desulfopila aestuarii]SHO46807.1 epoxyqueuosine reductase [Desulfopila aestuarii DSM 18488]